MTLRSPDRPRVAIVGADRATLALLEEWLLADGIEPFDGRLAAPPDASRPARSLAPADIVLVDVAFPRDQGVALLRSVADVYPEVPIVALSSGFFANVDCSGPCARQLGVAGVLPKPVPREALLHALRTILASRR